ncbi:MAG: TspO/MBR family protein [Patescibacteria group bacterium]
MDTYNWYSQLIKPSWAPPSWLFGPVWSILYILIAVSFGAVFWRLWSKKKKKKLAIIIALPFALNLIFNALFTPIQFGLQNNILAAIDILFVLATLVWAMKFIYPYARWITYMQIPYLLWVSFATVLQLTITYLNR